MDDDRHAIESGTRLKELPDPLQVSMHEEKTDEGASAGAFDIGLVDLAEGRELDVAQLRE